MLLFVAISIYNGSLLGAEPLSVEGNEKPAIAINPGNAIPESGFYDWHTRSQFSPVNQSVAGKDTQELCKAFPKDLLRDIQLVLKTGHGVLETRVETHLQSVSACLDSTLLIFSDLDAEIDDYQVIDVLSDLRTEFVRGNDQLEGYVLQTELAANGMLNSEAASRVKGGKLTSLNSCRKCHVHGVCGQRRGGMSSMKTTHTLCGTICSACSPISIPICRGTLAPRHQVHANYGWPTVALAMFYPAKLSEDLSKTTSIAIAHLSVLRLLIDGKIK